MPSSVARDASNRYTIERDLLLAKRTNKEVDGRYSILATRSSRTPILPCCPLSRGRTKNYKKNFQLFISSVQNAHYRYCEEIDREIFWWRTIEGVIFATREMKQNSRKPEKKREICRGKNSISASRPCRQLLRRRRVHGVSHMQVWVCAYVRGKKRDPLGRDVEERKAFLTLYPNSRQNSFFLGTMIYKKKDEVADLTDGWCPWLLFYYPDGGPRALDDNRPSTGQRDWAFPSQYLRFLLPFTTCYTRLHFSPFAYFRTVV